MQRLAVSCLCVRFGSSNLACMIWKLTSSAVVSLFFLRVQLLTLELTGSMHINLLLLVSYVDAQFGLSHPLLDAVAPEEPSEGKIIHRRGRFQVMSDSISQKVLNYLNEKLQFISIVNCLLYFLFLYIHWF